MTVYCLVVSTNVEHSRFNGDEDGDEFHGQKAKAWYSAA